MDTRTQAEVAQIAPRLAWCCPALTPPWPRFSSGESLRGRISISPDTHRLTASVMMPAILRLYVEKFPDVDLTLLAAILVHAAPGLHSLDLSASDERAHEHDVCPRPASGRLWVANYIHSKSTQCNAVAVKLKPQTTRTQKQPSRPDRNWLLKSRRIERVVPDAQPHVSCL